MARKTKCTVFVLIFISLTFFVPKSTHAWIKANESEIAFIGGGNGDDTTATPQSRLSSPGMAQLIAQGAGAFLVSHSNYLTFLNKYEVSELENTAVYELDQSLDNAVNAMEKAVNIYTQLKNTADRTPYNYSVY